MLARPQLPETITVTATAAPSVTADGRIVIPAVDYSAGVEAARRRVEAYALALDVFAKKESRDAPGRYTFRLQRWAIGAPGRLDYWDGYGILVPFPLDWAWFTAHAEIEGHGQWPRYPDEQWPRRVGPGAGPGVLRSEELPPVGWEQIDTAADGTDAKWADVGFRAGEPWSGAFPRLDRHERRAVTGQGADGAQW